jgi:hypothetical protein
MFNKKIEKLYEDILFRKIDSDGIKSYINSTISANEVEQILLNSQERFNCLINLEKKYLIDMPRELPKSCRVDFWDTDEEFLFEKNKKKLGKNWIWYDEKITYDVNSLGYRMKEFDDIDWKNYILTLGCSFTAGTGIPATQTWPHKISNHLKCDLVNAGIPGGGNDLMVSNLIQLFSYVKTRPKLVIVSWSSLSRISYPYNDKNLLYGTINQTNTTWSTSYLEYYKNYTQWHRIFMNYKKTVDLICNLADVPVWHISNFGDLDVFKNIVKIYPEQPNYKKLNIDKINEICGRDYEFKSNVSHPGIKMHKDVYAHWNIYNKEI